MTKAIWLLTVMAIVVAISLGVSEAATDGVADKALYDKAMKYYYAGKYEDSARLLKEYLKETADPKAYFRLGYSLYKLGRHDEANKYFEQSYLVTPDYTPTPELEEKHKQLKHVRPEGYYEGKIIEAPPAEEPPAEVPEGMVAVEEASMLSVPELDVEAETEAPTEEAPPAEEVAPEPKPEPKPATAAPPRPRPQTRPPVEISDKQAMFAALAMLSAFLIPIIAILGLIYLLFSFALFKIAKKRNLEKISLILCFIPVLQVIPMVQASGKSLLFAALMFVPLVNLAILVIVWMDIAENLGKSRKTALIVMIVSIFISPVFFGFVLYLGFSKGDGGALAPIESTDEQDFSGEPALDLPDVPEDFDDLDIGSPEDMGDMDDMDFSEPDFDDTDFK